MVLIFGVLTAAFTVVGSLEGITSFASLTFIVVFGGMSYLALEERHEDDISAVPPSVGLVGSAVFLPLMLWNKFSTHRGVFYTLVGLAVVAVAVELLYFETGVFGPAAGEDPMAGGN